MVFYISEEFLKYELGNIFRIFFPYEELKIVDEDIDSDISVKVLGDSLIIKAKIYGEEFYKVFEVLSEKKEVEHKACFEIYQIFSKITGESPSWGMLTGIHPVKHYANQKAELGQDGADNLFREQYFVSEKKIDFCKSILKTQEPILNRNKEKDFSLYVSIPFCPTRCSYCSFVSQSTEKSAKLIEEYFPLMLEEIRFVGDVVKENSLNLKSVYIGGGTPTTLSADMLKTLIKTIRENFDFSLCEEFTVEAGRPDTIDEEKLLALKKSDVKRISINPQTLNETVLKNIGRNHSVDEFFEKFKLAKKIGFETINVDLIAGLEGDTVESFKNSLDEIIKLIPENITVHSLALKRSAKIFREDETRNYHGDKDRVKEMMEYTSKMLTGNNYMPYYTYRQSRTAGNEDNTGWTKKGHECIYNVYTMDESQTIIACGGGGVSKIKDPYSNRLERIFNFKYPYEYINRFDEIISRKSEVTKLYGQFCKRVY